MYSLTLATLLGSSLAASQTCRNQDLYPNGFAPIKALCVLSPAGNETVHGTVEFNQVTEDLITISYNVKSDKPNTSHGFHVHAVGDIGDSCANAGAHYNPFEQTHGAPWDCVRHVGDLPMLNFDAAGNAEGLFVDYEVKLFGNTSVIGRSVVLHAGVDDYGKGGNAASLANGNSRAREACCVITKI